MKKVFVVYCSCRNSYIVGVYGSYLSALEHLIDELVKEEPNVRGCVIAILRHTTFVTEMYERFDDFDVLVEDKYLTTVLSNKDDWALCIREQTLED